MKIEKDQNEALNKTDVIKRLNFKLKEYKQKRDIAQLKCDKQEKYDVSFEAEVEDEILLLAQIQYEAVLDVVNYILN